MTDRSLLDALAVACCAAGGRGGGGGSRCQCSVPHQSRASSDLSSHDLACDKSAQSTRQRPENAQLYKIKALTA